MRSWVSPISRVHENLGRKTAHKRRAMRQDNLIERHWEYMKVFMCEKGIYFSFVDWVPAPSHISMVKPLNVLICMHYSWGKTEKKATNFYCLYNCRTEYFSPPILRTPSIPTTQILRKIQNRETKKSASFEDHFFFNVLILCCNHFPPMLKITNSIGNLMWANLVVFVTVCQKLHPKKIIRHSVF